MKLSLEEAKKKNPDGRLYDCEHYRVWAHKRSCFFCQHLTDIWWDYTNGPYMFLCEQEEDPAAIERGMKGECPSFKEEENEKNSGGLYLP